MKARRHTLVDGTSSDIVEEVVTPATTTATKLTIPTKKHTVDTTKEGSPVTPPPSTSTFHSPTTTSSSGTKSPTKKDKEEASSPASYIPKDDSKPPRPLRFRPVSTTTLDTSPLARRSFGDDNDKKKKKTRGTFQSSRKRSSTVTSGSALENGDNNNENNPKKAKQQPFDLKQLVHLVRALTHPDANPTILAFEIYELYNYPVPALPILTLETPLDFGSRPVLVPGVSHVRLPSTDLFYTKNGKYLSPSAYETLYRAEYDRPVNPWQAYFESLDSGGAADAVMSSTTTTTKPAAAVVEHSEVDMTTTAATNPLPCFDSKQPPPGSKETGLDGERQDQRSERALEANASETKTYRGEKEVEDSKTDDVGINAATTRRVMDKVEQPTITSQSNDTAAKQDTFVKANVPTADQTAVEQQNKHGDLQASKQENPIKATETTPPTTTIINKENQSNKNSNLNTSHQDAHPIASLEDKLYDRVKKHVDMAPDMLRACVAASVSTADESSESMDVCLEDNDKEHPTLGSLEGPVSIDEAEVQLWDTIDQALHKYSAQVSKLQPSHPEQNHV